MKEQTPQSKPIDPFAGLEVGIFDDVTFDGSFELEETFTTLWDKLTDKQKEVAIKNSKLPDSLNTKEIKRALEKFFRRPLLKYLSGRNTCSQTD